MFSFSSKDQLLLRANAPSLSLSPPYLYSCKVAPRPPYFITHMYRHFALAYLLGSTRLTFIRLTGRELSIYAVIILQPLEKNMKCLQLS